MEIEDEEQGDIDIKAKRNIKKRRFYDDVYFLQRKAKKKRKISKFEKVKKVKKVKNTNQPFSIPNETNLSNSTTSSNLPSDALTIKKKRKLSKDDLKEKTKTIKRVKISIPSTKEQQASLNAIKATAEYSSRYLSDVAPAAADRPLKIRKITPSPNDYATQFKEENPDAFVTKSYKHKVLKTKHAPLFLVRKSTNAEIEFNAKTIIYSDLLNFMIYYHFSFI